VIRVLIVFSTFSQRKRDDKPLLKPITAQSVKIFTLSSYFDYPYLSRLAERSVDDQKGIEKMQLLNSSNGSCDIK
jgi:hypothetical protein